MLKKFISLALVLSVIICLFSAVDIFADTSYEVVMDASTYGILNRYSVSSTEVGVKTGKPIVGSMRAAASNVQCLSSMKSDGFLDKSQIPSVSYMVNAEAKGVYNLEIDYKVVMKNGYSLKDYYMVISVNDTHYYKAFYRKNPNNGNWSLSSVYIQLDKGVNTIRCMSVVGENYDTVEWLNHDCITLSGNGALTAMLPQTTHLQSNNSSYVNGFTVSDTGYTTADWNKGQLCNYRGMSVSGANNVTYTSLSSDNMQYLCYFAYTVTVPFDGYYDMSTYISTGAAGATGYLITVVDGVKQKHLVVDANDNIAYNRNNISRYLTAGTHTVAISGIFDHSSYSSNKGYTNWCDMGALTVSGGIVKSNTQVNPLDFGCTSEVAANSIFLKLGDVNSDNRINTKDLLRYKRYFADSSIPFAGELSDLTGDGYTNSNDVTVLIKILLLNPVELKCEHIYENDTPLTSRCKICGESEEDYMPKSIKVLAIGNSFSDDATEHLWNIFKAAGIEEIIVANMYIGGCSIDTHYYNVTNDLGAYEYRKNTSGYIQNTSGTKISTALADEDWDIVTMQQASGYSGKPDSYSNLTNLISYVRARISNECRLYWHMTWAYQSGYSGLSNYNNDQMTMYNAICNTVNEKVVPLEVYESIIPSGTAVQNLRTSYFGDTLTRDGFHMSYDYGRYLTGLTWFATFGGDFEAIDWVPSKAMCYDLPAIKEAVKNALNSKYAVTQSTHTVKPEISDADILDLHGKNINLYSLLELDETVCAYWNSTDAANHSVKVTTASNSPNFIATATFTKSQLPVGSVIIVDSGYQYRPEGWYTFGTQNTTYRPANVSTNSVVVDSNWWGSFTTRAFNVSKISGAAVSSNDLGKLRIYVPKAGLSDSEIFSVLGKSINDYATLSLDETVCAYWNSTDAANHSVKVTAASNSPNFIATATFTKSQLPVGSVIIVDSGYQYRPEGWYTFGTQNTTYRPDNVSAAAVVVDDAWWGAFTTRAFNVSKTAGGVLSATDLGKLRIYIPK